MDELFEITKDYFKKTDEEKNLIFNDIYIQLEYLIVQSRLDPEMVYVKLDRLREKSEEIEHYEVSELYKNLNERLKQNFNV